MQVEIIVSNTLRELCPTMHAKRRTALCSAVGSALYGHALTVTALGRGAQGEALEKHRIKRLDRVLSNQLRETTFEHPHPKPTQKPPR